MNHDADKVWVFTIDPCVESVGGHRRQRIGLSIARVLLWSRGWQVPAYSLPANRQDLSIQRILVRHGVSRDLGSLLVDDMDRAIDYFKQHPVHTPMTSEEASGFHH